MSGLFTSNDVEEEMEGDAFREPSATAVSVPNRSGLVLDEERIGMGTECCRNAPTNGKNTKAETRSAFVFMVEVVSV